MGSDSKDYSCFSMTCYVQFQNVYSLTSNQKLTTRLHQKPRLKTHAFIIQLFQVSSWRGAFLNSQTNLITPLHEEVFYHTSLQPTTFYRRTFYDKKFFVHSYSLECLCMFISIFNLIFLTLISSGCRNQQRYPTILTFIHLTPLICTFIVKFVIVWFIT
jgi:hypothetical protein